MKRFRPRLERAGRWLGPAVLLALVPKCALCLLAYAGFGAVLGLGGPEICGAPPGLADVWAGPVLGGAGLAALAWLYLAARAKPRRT